MKAKGLSGVYKRIFCARRSPGRSAKACRELIGRSGSASFGDRACCAAGFSLWRQIVAVDDHAIVQSPDDLAAGVLKGERQQGMAKACDGADEHRCGEPGGVSCVLQVAFIDVLQVLIQVFHGELSYATTCGLFL